MRKRVFVTSAIAVSLTMGVGYPAVRAIPAGRVDAAHLVALARACRGSRWRVETASDAGARSLIGTPAQRTTIGRLAAFHRPSRLLERRVLPAESTVWSVRTTIVRERRDADGDDRLVLHGAHGATMMAVLPARGCLRASSPFLTAVTRARAMFEGRIHPSRQWRSVRMMIDLSGIGFFAPGPQQAGAAANGLELSPVLAINFVRQSQAGPTATPTSTVTPPPAPTATPTATSEPEPTDAQLQAGIRLPVGSYQVWMKCTGGGGPTVMMDTGYGSNSTVWSAVTARTSTFVRTCVYDRPGQGRTWGGNGHSTSQEIVEVMHTLLHEAHLAPPYVLVGHSFGGMNIRLFAYTYPKEAAGLVEVDAVHEDECAKEPDSFCAEPEIPTSFAQVRAARHGPMAESLGNRPLIVLTRDTNDAWWNSLQDDLATASTNSVHVVAVGSGHSIEKDNPALVAAAIREIVEAVRASSYRLPPSGPPLTDYGARCLG
jgi:pimeloyl-ACP methyl ester carboxylesterase